MSYEPIDPSDPSNGGPSYIPAPYGPAPYGPAPYGPQPPYGPAPYGPAPYGPAPYGAQPGYGPQPSAYSPVYGYPQPRPDNGLGIAGFVCGVLALVLFWFPIVGLGLAVLGISLSGAGLAHGRRVGASTGLAIAGLVCALVALIPAVLILLVVAA